MAPFKVLPRLSRLQVQASGLRLMELISMGDLQDPNKWRYVNVPYFWPYFAGIFPEI
jgi:hypothetical protein